MKTRRLLALMAVLALCGAATAQSTPTAQTGAGTEEIYVAVEKAPEYPGGMEKLYQFIAANIQYPAEAKAKGIQGTVYVSFVVERDGTISQAKVLRGIGGGCDEEVLRIVGLMPRWKPGKHQGKKVRVQFNLPVKFTL